MQTVEFPDLEVALLAPVKAALAEWSPIVGKNFPAPEWTPGMAVVVRDDSGPTTSPVTAARRVGFTVIGALYRETRAAAERLAAWLRAVPDMQALPIADATVRGPYSLDATGRVEFYLTAELVVVGHSVTL